MRSFSQFSFMSKENCANKSVKSSGLLVNRAANPLITLINSVCVVMPGCHTSLLSEKAKTSLTACQREKSQPLSLSLLFAP